MAFVALDKEQKDLLGVARLSADPDYVTGEYAIIVRSDLKGTGIGWTLMRHLIAYAEKEGLRELVGDVLANNQRMLEMCRALGFGIATDPEDASIRKVRLKLPAALKEPRLTSQSAGAQRGGARCPVRSWSGTLVRSFCRSPTTSSAMGLLRLLFSSVSTPGGATSTKLSN